MFHFRVLLVFCFFNIYGNSRIPTLSALQSSFVSTIFALETSVDHTASSIIIPLFVKLN